MGSQGYNCGVNVVPLQDLTMQEAHEEGSLGIEMNPKFLKVNPTRDTRVNVSDLYKLIKSL